MAKYHINEAGEAGKCAATQGRCPFGGEAEHFDSLAEAVKRSEEQLEQAHGVPGLRKSTAGPDSSRIALKKNTAVRGHLKKLPRSSRQAITGGYLDLTPHVELSEDFVKRIDAFSEESDRQHKAMLKQLETMPMKLREDQSASEAFLAAAEQQKEDGFKNEYVLAAALSRYEGVEVFMPTGNIPSGGKPKVDMVVALNGEQYHLSIKKTNGTQIETYTSRATVAEITPGPKATELIEKTSNRIFYFRPKYQAFATKPEEAERLRLLKDGSPKLSGASVRIEYGELDKIPADRPTLPEESAVVAFGGVSQTEPMTIHNAHKENVGSIQNSAARALVIGDFSKLSSLDDAPTPKEILSGSMPISRNGIRARKYGVMLRVSSMGNRTGDWVTDSRHVTDLPSLSLRAYTKALKEATA